MSDEWNQAGGIRARHYQSYDEYREHQASKFPLLDLRSYNVKFKRALLSRLDFLSQVPCGANVLCLGARNGSECEVFIERGYFAVGIDLNPGHANRTVLHGDFHNLQFGDETVDVIYTNALDHVFDFDRAVEEARRVLKRNGLLVAEIVRGSKDENGREPGPYESVWWDHVEVVVKRIQDRGFTLVKRNQFSVPWGGDQCIFER